MGILKIAVTSGLLLSLALTVRIVVGLVAEVVREGRRPAPTVLDIATPDPGQVARAEARRAA